MADKGFVTFIRVLFGIGGAVIVAIAWARIMTLSDRILFTIIGLGGITFALSAILPFKYVLTKLGIIRDLQQIQPREE